MVFLIQTIMESSVNQPGGLLLPVTAFMKDPSEPVTFVQQLPNVFQTSMIFGTRWAVAVQTSLVHRDTVGVL